MSSEQEKSQHKQPIFTFDPASVKIQGKPIIFPKQQILISWDKQFENVFNNLCQFIKYDLHTDITIWVQGKKFNAHRILLSTASGYFHGLLKKCRTQHTTIHFENFTAQNMEYVLKYIYRGRCSMSSENLEGFIQTAKQLQIYSLSYDQNNLSKPNAVQLPKIDMIGQSKPEEKKYFVKTSKETNFETLLTLMQSNLDPTSVKTQNFKCHVCNISFSNLYCLKRHRNSLFHKVSLHKNKNLNDKTLQCPLCDKTFAHRDHLICHYKCHENLKINPKYKQFLLYYLLKSDNQKEAKRRKMNPNNDSQIEEQQFIISKETQIKKEEGTVNTPQK